MLRRLLTLLSYLAVVALVMGVTVTLVAVGRGYRYDFKSHRIIQTGQVIIESKPSGVPVTLNGKLLKNKTGYQASFEAGSYIFSLAKSGFHTWTKTLAVVPSNVTLADYVILVPDQPPTSILDTHAQIVAQAISRDHRHLAYITGGSEAGLYVLDLGNPKPTRIYTPKPAAPTTGLETLSGVSWSDDASHLLLVSQLASSPIHQVMSAAGGDVRNLTSTFGFNFTGVGFSGSNWQQLYWISPDGLRRLDLASQTVSAVLADKVSQFTVAPDRILYIQTTELGRTLWSIDSRGRTHELVQALPESEAYSIAFTVYNGVEQLAVVPSKTGVATLYSDIYGSNPVAQIIARGVTTATFSPNGRLIVFWSPTTTQTYDLERSILTAKLVLYQFPASVGLTSAMTWFDNYHLLSTRDSRVIWSEYDGANDVDLGSAQGSLAAYGSSDTRTVYSFATAGDAVRIIQTTIRP